MNAQFKSVFAKDDDDTPTPNLNRLPYPQIGSLTVITEGVEKLLENLVTHKASGPDKIPNHYLKMNATRTAGHLHPIIADR